MDVYNKKSENKPLKIPKGIESANLPPCKMVLEKHALRAKYITLLWTNLNKPNPPDVHPEEYGWVMEGSYAIQWYTGSPLPEKLEEILLTKGEDDERSENGEESDASGEDSDSQEE